MSGLLSLFSNDGLKKTILKTFVTKMKEQGITRGLVKIDEKDNINFEPLNDDLVLVEKKDLEFYQKFFNDNKLLDGVKF